MCLSFDVLVRSPSASESQLTTLPGMEYGYLPSADGTCISCSLIVTTCVSILSIALLAVSQSYNYSKAVFNIDIIITNICLESSRC